MFKWFEVKWFIFSILQQLNGCYTNSKNSDLKFCFFFLSSDIHIYTFCNCVVWLQRCVVSTILDNRTTKCINRRNFRNFCYHPEKVQLKQNCTHVFIQSSIYLSLTKYNGGTKHHTTTHCSNMRSFSLKRKHFLPSSFFLIVL